MFIIRVKREIKRVYVNGCRYTLGYAKKKQVKELMLFVYYESKKRDLKRRLIYEYQCDERLKTKKEESTLLSDTEVVVQYQIHRCRLLLLTSSEDPNEKLC